MRKLLLLTLFAAAPAFSQTCTAPTSIQITGPLNALAGVMSGNIDLQLNYTISGNPPVVQSELQVQVIAGIMSVSGVALVCLPPGSSVVANYALSKPAPLSGTTHFVRYWVVPASGGPYAVSSIESATAATPSLSPLPLSLLSPNLSATLPLVLTSGVFSCPTCGSGGGGSPGGSINAAQYNLGSGVFGGVLNASATNKFLTQSSSGPPAWNTILLADLPTIPYSQTTGVQAALGYTPLNAASNLSDLASVSTARTNLGLGSAATQSSSAFEPAITTGTTSQYWRGDKTWRTFTTDLWANLSAVGPLSFNSSTGAFSCASCLTSSLVSSVFGRTGAVVATSGDYTTAQVTESGSLYFTNARAVSALAGLYEVPLTFGAGLNRSTNTITVPAGGITNAMLAGSIAASKLVGTDIVIPASQTTGFAAVATSGSASDLGTGTLPAARLPNPSATTLGGVESIAAVSHQFLTSISTSGVPSKAQPAAGDVSGLANSATTDTTNASNITSGTLPHAQLPTSILPAGFGVMFRGADAAAGGVLYVTIPYACTITDWVITADSTATVKVWRIADGGTAVPTVSNNLSTSGFSLASGTRLHSSTLTDLSSTAIAAYDTFGINLYASASTHVEFLIGCAR